MVCLLGSPCPEASSHDVARGEPCRACTVRFLADAWQGRHHDDAVEAALRAQPIGRFVEGMRTVVREHGDARLMPLVFDPLVRATQRHAVTWDEIDAVCATLAAAEEN